MEQDKVFMRRAIALASESVQRGGGPFGAVIVRNGDIVAEGTNSVTLQAFLCGALTKVSKSLVNNSQFDIVGFVVNDMAENIARWLELQLLIGDHANSRIDGLSQATNSVTGTAATYVTGDDLINLQDAVKDAFQRDAVWIMAPSTRNAVRKLKDLEGRYLLNPDMTAKWGYTLLGKPVYVSDNMDVIGAGKKAIYYGDMSGLALKISESIDIEVLREKYATEHAIGVVGYLGGVGGVDNYSGNVREFENGERVVG